MTIYNTAWMHKQINHVHSLYGRSLPGPHNTLGERVSLARQISTEYRALLLEFHKFQDSTTTAEIGEELALDATGSLAAVCNEYSKCYSKEEAMSISIEVLMEYRRGKSR